MNKCVNCDSGRNGSCPWASRFTAPEVKAVPGGETHEARAIALDDITGGPCPQQITFDQLIDQIDTCASLADLPKNEEELHTFLTRLELCLKRLSRLPKSLRPVFAESIPAAIEHALAALDYRYLKKGLNISGLIQQVHEGYDRESIFDCCGIPKVFVNHYKSTATPYQIFSTPTTSTEDPVATTIANLPPELSSTKAMAIWNKARAAGIIDDEYHFTSKRRNELAVFAGSFSMLLFKEIRWKPFEQWQPYDNYAKTYSDFSNNPPHKMAKNMRHILDFFQTITGNNP